MRRNIENKDAFNMVIKLLDFSKDMNEEGMKNATNWTMTTEKERKKRIRGELSDK